MRESIDMRKGISMNKNKAIFALAGLLLATTVGITAYAQPGPDSFECSPNPGQGAGAYELTEINEAENKKQCRSVDLAGNKDHHCCEKTSGPGATYIDNGED
jgi:hypothetical protein